MNEDWTPDAPQSQPQPPAGQQDKAKKWVSGAFDYLEMFAWSVFAVLLIFTFGIRLCRVDGESMENTLYDGQNLLLWSAGYTPQQDDIIVFHLTKPQADLQKTLVKRVIAVGGQEIVIDTNTGTITVDGEVYEDTHAVLKNRTTDEITGTYSTSLFRYDFDPATGIFRATVPEHTVFVMGDNRNNSKDSRDTDVGFVDERCILGKVTLRLVPFTIFS